ncbi:MAG: SDR family oxidoreductase [Chloroflexi bacterium]|nr:SDR family oxidoreductase [Chloroflexota bacterium]
MTLLDRFRLDDQVALVTGANQGVGQALAVALAEVGANIVGLDGTPDCDDTRQQVEVLGRSFMPVVCDLQAASVGRLTDIISEIVLEQGRLDILINNAGVVRRAPALAFKEKDWDDVLQVNLKAVFFLSQAVARVMAEAGGGKIIHVASLLAWQGGILVPSNTAAASGVAGLTRAMANEWAPKGINVNAIAPGYLAAPQPGDSDESRAILARIPAGRWGEPDDLKGAAVFLASDAARYVHGAIIPVDGAWLAR